MNGIMGFLFRVLEILMIESVDFDITLIDVLHLRRETGDQRSSPSPPDRSETTFQHSMFNIGHDRAVVHIAVNGDDSGTRIVPGLGSLQPM